MYAKSHAHLLQSPPMLTSHTSIVQIRTKRLALLQSTEFIQISVVLHALVCVYNPM